MAQRVWTLDRFACFSVRNQFLTESGKMKSQSPQLADAIMSDIRFSVDEVSLAALVQKSLQLGWTRDPFDRLIGAHSLVRRIPLCSVDEIILKNHKLLVPELL